MTGSRGQALTFAFIKAGGKSQGLTPRSHYFEKDPRMIRKLFILSFIVFTQAAYAAKPVACPNLPIVKMVGIEHVSLSGGVWAGYIFRNHFDTEQEWSFAI